MQLLHTCDRPLPSRTLFDFYEVLLLPALEDIEAKIRSLPHKLGALEGTKLVHDRKLPPVRRERIAGEAKLCAGKEREQKDGDEGEEGEPEELKLRPERQLPVTRIPTESFCVHFSPLYHLTLRRATI